MNYVYVATFTGNIIAFIAATSLTWTSPMLTALNSTSTTPFEKIPTGDELSSIGSFLPLGGSLGPFIFGFLADKIGRKYSLLSLGLPFLVCYLIMAFGKTLILFYVARFIIGLAVGGVFTVVPMYIGEIAEDSNRGALASSMNVFICTGLLFSYAVGPYMSVKNFNIVLSVFPAIYLVLFFLLGTESVHYYVAKEEHEGAREALLKIRKGTKQEIERELEEIQTKIKSEGHGSFLDIFKSKGLIKAFVISVGLVTFQQLSGINAVLFYAQNIFKAAHTTLEPALCSIIVGIVQFLTSFITPAVAEKLNRKLLLVVSAIGMALSEIVLGVYFYLADHGTNVENFGMVPIVSLVMYIIIYNSGYGPLPWTMLAELFPSNVKSAASATTASACWSLGFLITKYFNSIATGIGMGPSFGIFAALCLVAAVFSYTYVIETKGRSLREIQVKLNR